LVYNIIFLLQAIKNYHSNNKGSYEHKTTKGFVDRHRLGTIALDTVKPVSVLRYMTVTSELAGLFATLSR